ncbi:MAG: LysM peptidoglycan-binding domain-containing protein [Lactobacillus kalixensis]|uniref:LysM peptidoglycan-binding domain-containing protein n=3 Tax=Lactobacillaceae TaxID=33958 RepID=UPI0007EF1C73|nr:MULTISPECIES: LysM domain-containing protein [Lactobacillus]MDE3335743.1 LysM domain-containing protein [Lactobacillus paragasseri]MDE3399373.1 LysM domain-containing protein [Lactobacillus paragasseri]
MFLRILRRLFCAYLAIEAILWFINWITGSDLDKPTKVQLKLNDYYQVTPGDTWRTIAYKYAMSVEELLKVNCAKAVDVLSIGQYGFNLVKIPSSWLHMEFGLSFLHDTSPLVNKIGRTIDQFLLLAISRIIDIVYYGYSMIRFTTGDMTGLGIIRLVMFSNDYQKKEMISYD